MDYNGNDMNNPMEDIAKDIGNKALDKGKEAGKRVAKKAMKKAGKMAMKALKHAGKAALKALSQVIIAALPYILVAVGIILIIVMAWYILFEVRGAEGNYSMGSDGNELQMTDSGYYASTSLSGTNLAIQDFYTYYGEHAYYQILGDDNTKLQKPDGTVEDYYHRESEFSIDPNFIFVLDETMYRGKFRYPEQFIKPLNYDPKTMKLKQLTDEKGNVNVESAEYDSLTGFKTGKKTLSVNDYGYGSIFKYKEADLTHTLEGSYVSKDVFDTSCACVRTVAITPEPFVEKVPGYPMKITLMEKVITFAMDVELGYELQKTPYDDLQYGESKDTKQNVTKIWYGTYDEYRTRTVSDGVDKNGKPKYKEEEYLYATHQLYKYREGMVYETKPVPAPHLNVENKYGTQYFTDYLMNFKAWVPENVMAEFNLHDRIGNYLASDIKVGSGANSSGFDNALQYFSIIQKYSDMYGADPYLILALMTQESGGNADVEDGLMQIVGNTSRSVQAKNIQTGRIDTFTVANEMDRRNPDKAIHWGVMYFMANAQNFGGDPLKTIQSYNFNPSGYMKTYHPNEWQGTAWLNYREEARLYYASREQGWSRSKSASYGCNKAWDPGDPTLPTYGDVCYIENVLRYYAGDNLTVLDNFDTDKAGKDSAAKQQKKKEKKEAEKQFYDDNLKRLRYDHETSYQEASDILTSITTFVKKTLFSEVVESGNLSFFEDDFTTKTGNLSADEFIQLIPGADGFIPPVNIPNVSVSSNFGTRVDPVTHKPGAFHAGVDVQVPIGTPIYAITDGIVEISIGTQRNSKVSYGNYITIKHSDGVTSSLYGHLDSVLVNKGDKVIQGQLIGYSGNSGKSTGAHLHFGLKLNGNWIDGYYVVKRPDAFNEGP